MNEIAAERWVQSWDADNASYDAWLEANKKNNRNAEQSSSWLGRMTNSSYKAWLARGGVGGSVE